VHVDCLNDRSTLCERQQHFADFKILFAVIPLSALSAVPEADPEDTSRGRADSEETDWVRG
jgi:hypothetical protein